LKKRPNTHRSKHKDRRSHESNRARKQRSLGDKRARKYGVSILLDTDSLEDRDES
jgi:hypothetical protein